MDEKIKTMKKLVYITLVAFAMLTVMVSCHKENIPMPDVGGEDAGLTPASAAKFQEIRARALENLKQTETFRAEDGIFFISENGARVYIQPRSLRDENDNIVTGDVTLSFIELYDRGSMVVTNKPLMGQDPGNGGALVPLVTGGQYQLEVTQADRLLKPANTFDVSIPTSLTGGKDDDMSLWKGEFDEDGNLSWAGAESDVAEFQPPMMIDSTGVDEEDPRSYNIWQRTFRWINIDRFWHDSRPKTPVSVSVPMGYSDQNAAVYLAFETEPNVLMSLVEFNEAGNYFSPFNGELPIGLTIHVIFVSESDGEVVHAIKTTTIAEGTAITIGSSELQTGTTVEQLVDLVNALD